MGDRYRPLRHQGGLDGVDSRANGALDIRRREFITLLGGARAFGSLAVHSPRAAGQSLAHRFPGDDCGGAERNQHGRVPPGHARAPLHRGAEFRDRVPLGRRPQRAISGPRSRARPPQRRSDRDPRDARGDRGQECHRDDPDRHGGKRRPARDRRRCEPRAAGWQRHRLERLHQQICSRNASRSCARRFRAPNGSGSCTIWPIRSRRGNGRS